MFRATSREQEKKREKEEKKRLDQEKKEQREKEKKEQEIRKRFKVRSLSSRLHTDMHQSLFSLVQFETYITVQGHSLAAKLHGNAISFSILGELFVPWTKRE